MDELRILKQARSDIESVRAADVAKARERLKALIDAETNSGAVPTPMISRPSWRRWHWAWASVAASVMALVLGLTLWPTSQLSSHAGAVEALTDAADTAAAMPAVSEEGAYIYSKTRATNLVTGVNFDVSEEHYSLTIPTTREIWKAPDGSGLIHTVAGQPEFLSDRDEQVWKAAGEPDFGPGTSTESFGPGELSYENFDGLPANGDELYSVLSDRARNAATTHDWALLTSVGEFLREAPTPELRQALYEVASRIPSIELVGETSDALGRRGTAVAIESNETGTLSRLELVFDPETSELLAQREVLLERDPELNHEPPIILSETTFISTGRTGSMPTRAQIRGT
ncbi:MAG: CU044_5270 family protein [Actinomycetota bacterium]